MSTLKIAILLAIVASIGGAYFFLPDVLTLDRLAEREVQLREFSESRPILVYGVAFLLYVTVTGLSLPGATVMTLVLGWLFGFWRAVILVSFASTTGATVAFVLSRYLFRDAIQGRFGDRLAAFNDNLAKEGAFYLFTLRLIPAVPFFVINVVMGLTPIRVSMFWWVSQLGMLPGTCLYVFTGASVPDLATLAERGPSGILTWKLVVAFALLGVFPIAVKKTMQAIRSKSQER